MLKHRRYQAGDEGLLEFAGTRRIDTEILALLKRNNEIIVVPINLATYNSIKRLAIGAKIQLGVDGIVIATGRGR